MGQIASPAVVNGDKAYVNPGEDLLSKNIIFL